MKYHYMAIRKPILQQEYCIMLRRVMFKQVKIVMVVPAQLLLVPWMEITYFLI